MSDPADKSDDLIAELAKLMAQSPARDSTVQPVTRPAPINPNATASPPPVRIPGMDAGSRPAATPAVPPTDGRAPATGTIRIPGMDQPAPPVSTGAPVSKFDFGKPVSAAPIKQEPLSTLSERLAAQNPFVTPTTEPPAAGGSPTPARIPSSLTPVSENRSFGEGPALTLRPAAPAPTPAGSAATADGHSGGGEFTFDFGFAQNPPTPSPLPRPVPVPPPAAAAPEAETVSDPIADLIAEAEDEPVEMPSAPVAAAPTRPAQVVTPMIRPVTTQAQPKPAIAPAATAPKPAANAPIPLKPVTAPPRAPDSDRFAVSPGVGLNAKPAADQPVQAPPARTPEAARPADNDPMAEIESLIGEAVRVELSPGPVRVQAPQPVAPKVELEPEADLEREIAQHQAAPEPAPVVPPLTTNFAPRRANLKDEGARSAEDAILAAAAASGAEVGRLDEPSVGDESPYRRLKVKPQRSSMLSGSLRQYIGMAVAGTLLLAAGLGLYWVLNMGRGSTAAANAPVLTADATPVKEKPADTPKPATDTAKSPVLAKIDGAPSAASSEQLVSTEQATADVTRDVTPVADTESGLANRKVRTVTVRPDGTIVSGDDAMAGGEALPVERPNVPAVPSTAATNLLGNDNKVAEADPLAAIAAPAAADPATTASTDSTQVADAQPVIDPTQVAPTPLPFPVRSTRVTAPVATNTPTNSSVNALVGAQTPNGQIDLLSGGNNVSATPPQQVAATQQPASTGGAAAYVQLSSQPSQDLAEASARSMAARYGSLFGGGKLVITPAQVNGKGTMYRVRLPASSLADASSICTQIKAQGGDCFATNG